MTTKRWVYLAIVFTGLWLSYLYRALIGPLVIACLLAYLLNPWVTLLKTRLRLSHRLAANLVYFGFLLALIVVLILLVPVVIRQASLVSGQFELLQREVIELQPALDSLLGFDLPLQTLVDDFSSEVGQATRPERVFRVIVSATGNLIWLLVIFITSFYLLHDWAKFREWLIGLAPTELEADLRRLQTEVKIIWQTYLRGQLLLMIVIGLLSALATALLGLRGYLVLGLLAGGLAIIPNLGPALAAIVAAGVAWVQGSTFLDLPNIWLALLVVVLFSAIQFVEGVFLQPHIMGRRLNLHPALVFIAVVSTLALVGALAGLIVVPLLGTAEILLRYAREKFNGP